MNQLALSISGVPISQPPAITNITNKYGAGLGQNLLAQGFRIAFFFVAILALCYFLFGAFKWIISQGDKKEIENSRNTMIYALMGMVITFLAFLVVNIIGRVFGVTLL